MARWEIKANNESHSGLSTPQARFRVMAVELRALQKSPNGDGSLNPRDFRDRGYLGSHRWQGLGIPPGAVGFTGP